MRIIILPLLLIPLIVVAYSNKFIFKTEKSCKMCIAEINKKRNKKNERFLCRMKESSSPEKGFFILMQSGDREKNEFIKLIEKEGLRKKESKRRVSIRIEQIGLVEKDIKELCPKAYNEISK